MDQLTKCQCEHISHFDADETDRWCRERTDHAYLAVPAGTARALYVGLICDHCANTHMSDYLTN